MNSTYSMTNYIILIIIIVFIMLIYLYRHKIFIIDNKKETYTLIDDEFMFNNDTQAQSIRIQDTKKEYSPIVFDNGVGLKFNVKFNIYISALSESDGWNDTYDSYKPVFKFGDGISIIYNPKDSKMKVNIRYRNSSYYDQWWNINTEIPQQKWTEIMVEINGRKSNLYKDGKMIKSMIGPNVPLLPQNSKEFISIGGGNFQGKLKNMVIEYN